MSGYHNRFTNHGSGYAHDDSEVYCEADELYLTMNGVNQFQSQSDTGRISAQLGNVLNQNKMPDQRAPPVSPRRNRPGNPPMSFGSQLPVQLPRTIPQPKERRHSSVTPGFHKWDRDPGIPHHPPTAFRPPMRMPPGLSMPPMPGREENDDQDDYLSFDSSLCSEQNLNSLESSMFSQLTLESQFGYDKPAPQILPSFPRPTQRQSYDDHTPPFRPPPQPPRSGSSKSDGHSPVTSRPPSYKDSGHSPIGSRPASYKDSGHSPVTSRPASYKDPMPFHMKDRRHNRSTDSASSTSSEDLTLMPKSVPTGGSMPFKTPRMTHFGSKPFQLPSVPNTSMPPLEIEKEEAPSKPASCTDFSKPTEEQSWFMNTSRDGAQQAIEANRKEGIFLVRPKHESNSQPYALTLWAAGSFKNLVIRKKSDGEYALGNSKPGELSFKSVVLMVDYYQRNQLNIADSRSVTLISGP